MFGGWDFRSNWALWLMTIAPVIIGGGLVLALVFGLGWLLGRSQ